MGTPEAKDYLASLLDFSGTEVAKLVRQHVPADRKLLDVGAGWAKYRILLNEYRMDAVEAWQPYVDTHKLKEFYDAVYVTEAVDFEYPLRYGAVILGDVLEHMSVEDAQATIRAACDNSDLVVVVVPFEMPQHEEEGNHHEIHIQDDLTEALMAERYPELKLHAKQKFWEFIKAIYVYD